MKKKLTSICVALTLLVTPVAFNGCATVEGYFNPSISQASADKAILRAEQTAQSARLTFHTLVVLEKNNEAGLKLVSPSIHEWADKLRDNGLNWVDSLRNATKAFKANRTPENRADLNTAFMTLSYALVESQKYLKQMEAAVK